MNFNQSRYTTTDAQAIRNVMFDQSLDIAHCARISGQLFNARQDAALIVLWIALQVLERNIGEYHFVGWHISIGQLRLAEDRTQDGHRKVTRVDC